MIGKVGLFIVNGFIICFGTALSLAAMTFPMAPQKLTTDQLIELKTDVFVKGINKRKRIYIRSVLSDSTIMGKRLLSADSVATLLLIREDSFEKPRGTLLTDNKSGGGNHLAFALTRMGVDTAVVRLPVISETGKLGNEVKMGENKCQLEVVFAKHNGIWKIVSVGDLNDGYKK